MDWQRVSIVLSFIQHVVALIGIIIIISGVIFASYQYISYIFNKELIEKTSIINIIRLNLGRTLILGLEFIVAADLIGTITAPDYYEVGLLAIIVLIRTLLTFSINRELMMIKEE